MRALARPVAVAVAALLTAGAAPAAAKKTIPIRNTQYQKPSVTVHKGELVVWKDLQGFTEHSVTSMGKPSFSSSRLLQKGDEFRVRFSSRGEYRYFCRVHPSSMSGRITVE